MKKFYSIRFITLFVILTGLSQALKAQELYWYEGFIPSGASANPGNAATITEYTGSAGVWYFYGVYRTTGTDCAGAGNPAGSNWHIRSVNNTDLVDTAYALTPLVSAGISGVHLQRSRANRRYTFYVTNDPSPTTTSWTLASVIPKATGYPTPLCLDSLVVINAPDAVRMMIKFERNGNSDVDSIGLVSSRPLPVKFTGINAASVNGLTKVTWNIATELNTRSYIVEKSTDGANFKNVAEVTATNAGTYSWIDQSANAGNVYYRVKSVDKDGKLGYSGVIKLSTALTKPGFVITPNVIPGRTMNLQLTNIVKGTVTVRVSNNMGQIVYATSLINEGGSVSKTISLPGTLQAGTYRVQLVSGSNLMTQTAILQ